MADSTTAAAAMAKSDTELASTLPIGLIIPSNLLLAKTLPFDVYEVPNELQVSLERTKQRWAWFTKAKDHDEERGTQLGTLGYLPWEIRQKIFGNIFDGCFDVQIDRHQWGDYGFKSRESRWRIWCNRKTFPYLWRGLAIRNVSTSMRLEVEHAFITMAHFEFEHDLTLFLDHLTTYERSLLRSIKIPLIGGPCVEWESETRMADCARLPSGLTSIIFEYRYCDLQIKPTEVPKLSNSLDLLGKQMSRCWTPRAKISTFHDCWSYPDQCHRPIAASAFNDLEPWSQGWLDWWASSQNHDQAEEQSSPPKDDIDES